MVEHACGPNYSGSWGRRTTWLKAFQPFWMIQCCVNLLGVFTKFGINMMTFHELGTTRFPKEGWTDSGQKKDRLSFIKMKTSHSVSIKKMKRQEQSVRRRYSQYIYLTRALHPEFIKNAFNNKMKNSPI